MTFTKTLIITSALCMAASGETITSAMASSQWVKKSQTVPGANSFTAASAVGAQITWYSGVDTLDGKKFADPAVKEGTENYFDAGPTGRKLTGFGPEEYGPGPRGSIGIHSGFGESTVKEKGNDNFKFKEYRAEFSVVADGKLGDDPKARYDTKTFAKDPWAFSAADFSDPNALYDLFFTAGLTGGHMSRLGGMEFQVGYETATGIANLFGVKADASGVSVTGELLPGLSLFLLPFDGVNPNETFGTPTSLGAIQSLLSADLLDRSLDTPLTVGFLLSGVSAPTTPLSSGALSQFTVDATALDAAQTPEPATMLLLGAGLIGLAFIRRVRDR